MAMGLASLVFAFASTLAIVTVNGVFFLVAGAAEIGVGMHAQGLGPVLFLGARRPSLHCRRRRLHPEPGFRLRHPDACARRGPDRGGRRARLSRLPAARPSPQRAMVFLAAAVTFLLGLMIVIHWPLSSIYVLGTLLGVDLLFHGAGWVSFGMGLRAHK